MKALQIITNKQKWAAWRRAFRIWQRKPHEVAPLSTESHECNSCGTTFTGNYCPRCGQSASIGRFSFKKTFLLFLDVWGLGNRGMFHSIRDLILRPGYMIRDYISGKQSAYFPPFKMFFLLVALSLLVEHGFSFGLEEKKEDAKIDPTTAVQELEQEEEGENSVAQVEPNQKEKNAWAQGSKGFNDAIKVNSKEKDPNIAQTIAVLGKFVKSLDILHDKNPTLFSFFILLLCSIPLYIFFRKAPSIPNLRYSEFVVALTYTSNMYSLYSITGTILGISLLELFATVMFIVALSQFSGFSKLRVLMKLIITAIISFVAIIFFFFAAAAIIYYLTK